MNLRPISSAKERPFRTACIRCGSAIQTDRDDKARADLDGIPFRAYYCGSCAETRATERAASGAILGPIVEVPA